MKKNEKQVITILGVAIAVVAIALVAMLITSRNTDNGSSASLKDAVQEEAKSSGNESNDVSESDAGESVSEEDAGEGGDNMTTEQPTTEEVTEAATTEAAKSKAKTASQVMDADDGYIFPDADSSYVSKSSVKKLSDEELQYAVNEIYARHGLKFTKKLNKERFEKKAWYVGSVDDQDDISLNKYEKKNVDIMAAELKKRGLR